VTTALSAHVIATSLSACGPDPEMRAACDAYIECVTHYSQTFDVDAPDTSDYEEGGVCDSEPRLADLCRERCEEHRVALGEALVIAGEAEGPCAD